MEKYIPRLRKHYEENVVPALKKQFNFKSSMQVPRLEKIAINQGVGAATADKKLIDMQWQRSVPLPDNALFQPNRRRISPISSLGQTRQSV
jgi:hypothetical protein